MKYAIMSDAHSNPAALKAALRDAKRRKCEKFIFLGDVTGYGYDVKDTMKLVKRHFDAVIMGNHDSVCAGLENSRLVQMNFHYDLDRAQQKQLAPADLDWIRSLKYVYENEDFIATHGDFIKPSDWGYIFDPVEACANFSACDRELMFCGHTHHASIWEMRDNQVRNLLEERFQTPAWKPESVSFKMKPGARYLVNVGSAGYPRNDFCCSYAIYDTTLRKVTIRRLPFDFLAYISSMTAAKIELPDWLVQILFLGAKPD